VLSRGMQDLPAREQSALVRALSALERLADKLVNGD